MPLGLVEAGFVGSLKADQAGQCRTVVTLQAETRIGGKLPLSLARMMVVVTLQVEGTERTLDLNLSPALAVFTRARLVGVTGRFKTSNLWAARPGKVYAVSGISVVFLLPGLFVMGSPKDAADRGSNEVQHTVTTSRHFALAQTPCTQGQWEWVMGNNPAHFRGSERPVEQVSWGEAVEYCRKLTAKQRAEVILSESWEWRLPTEAEW